MQTEMASPPDDQREFVDDRSSRSMKVAEAIVFLRNGMVGKMVEELTGISVEEAQLAATKRRGPLPYVPTPAEIAERARALRLARPGDKGLVARIQESEWDEDDDQWP